MKRAWCTGLGENAGSIFSLCKLTGKISENILFNLIFFFKRRKSVLKCIGSTHSLCDGHQMDSGGFRKELCNTLLQD